MIVACIPALNEADNIKRLVRSLLASCVNHVVVTDDGSTDGTGMMLSKSRDFTLITHEKRRGYAASVVDAWRVALMLHPTAILQLDAGNSHDPADAVKLLGVLNKTKSHLVIGSRFCKDAAYIGNRKRAILSRMYAIIASACFGHWFTDWTSGYRAFSPSLVPALINREYKAHAHGWNAEILRTALKLDARVAEAPITYRAGRSSLKRDGVIEALGVLRG